MIEAFFFGPNQGIFASYHPPVGGGAQVLTVICPPLFNEYMRTQLALRELAIELARRGQHVLRFDYRGTGDSLEDLDRVAMSDWIADIALAVREGRDLSGSGTVRLLGVRAGALLASHSARTMTDVQQVVLWDPVPDGAQYLRELRRIQERSSSGTFHLTRQGLTRRCTSMPAIDYPNAWWRNFARSMQAHIRAFRASFMC